LDAVDTKICRLKELMRSVMAGLPYPLPRDRIKDLVTYAVSRTNLKASTELESNVCPRVRLTRHKSDFKSELSLAIGDYVEAYNEVRDRNACSQFDRGG